MEFKKINKQTKTSRVIPIRWNEKSLNLFLVMGFLDKRDFKVTNKVYKMSFNKFINEIVFSSFVKGLKGFDTEKIQKRMKALSLKDLEKTRDMIEEEIKRIAKGEESGI